MNVFVLSRDHELRARYHCDVHVNKMLLESIQVLNTALHLNDAKDQYVFYQPTHKNHPWTEWAADRYANWKWMLDHAVALGKEFARRSEKDSHASYDKVHTYWLDADLSLDSRIMHIVGDDGERTSFPQCMPDLHVMQDDPVQAYRSYYMAEKVPEDWCTWSVEKPEWVMARQ
jgi:hypothetical protein